MCRQRIASLASYRPLYQAVLDAELTLMAEVALRLRNQFGAKPRQLRVDGCVCQIPKKHAKRLLEWREKRLGPRATSVSASLPWSPTAAP